MSESDTMFNERDRRCAAVQHMLSTNPSYDNRTIASTLKMQIWIATNNRDMPRVMKTKFPATVMVFRVVSSEGHIMPPHIFEVGLKVNTKVCNILICMQKHNQHNNDEWTQFFRKIFLSLYSKGLRKGYCVRGELETEQKLQHIDPQLFWL